MADEISCTIEGLEGVEAALRDAPRKMAVKYVRSAGKKAAKIMKESIADNMAVDTGFLSEHIGIQTVVNKGDEGSITVHIGPEPEAFYEVFDEFGANGRAGQHRMEHAAERVENEVLDTFVGELDFGLEDLKNA
ncbi:MAG TPA: HK97-gp10 family putative phage morphogenesis protein [Terriglobales bacterium]|nr:HK97-gp10 family putative phage morphogenesis protein [Terriglobales bacterium]